MKRFLTLCVFLFIAGCCSARAIDTLGLRLERYKYPYPVHFMKSKVQGSTVEIAYMDVKPNRPNGRTVLLMHGKNFPAAYWKGTIGVLSNAGYRVVAPDALGFGKSSKPVIQYSFSLLALLNKQLLDELDIDEVAVVGHSTGGMLATRFALSYPERVDKLILEDPIGLEDWRAKGVPYRKVDDWYKEERNASYDSVLKYQKNYYPVWKESYREWADVQYGPLRSKRANEYAKVSALTYDMIFTQPVVYEFKDLRMPVLLIIGQEDKTKIARKASAEVVARLGNYKKLGKQTARMIPNCKLIEYEGVGHIPHLQTPEAFYNDILRFLR